HLHRNGAELAVTVRTGSQLAGDIVAPAVGDAAGRDSAGVRASRLVMRLVAVGVQPRRDGHEGEPARYRDGRVADRGRAVAKLPEGVHAPTVCRTAGHDA